MSVKDIGNIPRIARELIGHLPQKMDDDLKGLLARAEKGQDTTFEIAKLFARNKYTQQWLNKNIKSLGGEKGSSHREHGPLAGNIVWIPPSQKWICPMDPNDNWFMVMQEDEDAPICSKHKVEMIREEG